MREFFSISAVIMAVCPGVWFVQSPQQRANSPEALNGTATTIQSYDGRTMSAALIRIQVPERRASPTRTISIAALRIPATAKDPGPPILFLMGGPGIPGTVMVPIPPYFTLFQRLRELGDVVIMDQRGIGESKPNVDCPVTSSLPADFFVDRARMVGAIRNGIAQCAELWRSKGADPTAYTTLESAEDIEDLRKALGVEKINLLAFSYGTRLALAYVDRHGDRVGRVILQGVDGPGMVLKRPAAVTLKLRRVGQFLGQDPAWHGSTDLLAAASVTRKRLAEKPATVVITDKATGQSRTLLIGRDGFDAIASLNLNNLRLPAMLVSAAVGEDRLLTRFAEATWNTFSSGTVGLAARAIDCAADRPDVRREAIAAESVTAPFGTPIDDAVLSDDFCRAVGYNVPLTEFAKPVSSSVPTLLLTGTLDATTPIENAIEVSQGLRNAVLLDVENAQHEALPVPDVQDIVVDFLHGVDVTKRRAATSIPHFLPIEDALQHGSER